MHLHSNQLTGEIPSWLVNLTEIRSLSLWSNQLTGTIPPEVAPAQDRAALVVLYIATGGPNWTDNTNWGHTSESRFQNGTVYPRMNKAASKN